MKHSRLIAVLLVCVMVLSFVQYAFAFGGIGEPAGAIRIKTEERPLPNGGKKTEKEIEVKPSESGAKAGAAAGAAVGAYFGPVGAAVGAAVGGALGWLLGPAD